MCNYGRESAPAPFREYPVSKRLVLILVCFSISLAAPLHADTVSVFNVSGLFANNTTMSGTLTIDTTTGMVTGANIYYSGDGLSYQTLGTQSAYAVGPTGVAYMVNVNNAGTSSTLGLAIQGTSALDSLIGYTGGSLCATSSPCSIPAEEGSEVSDWYGPSQYGYFQPIILQSGSLSSTVNVPEPGSVALLSIGLAGPFVLRRRRS